LSLATIGCRWQKKRAMAMQDPKPKGKKPRSAVQFPQSLWFWWLVSAALLVWSLFSMWQGPSSEVVDIPYSTFLEQLRADNVSKVHLAADVITGSLVKPLLWPRPERKIESKPAKAPASLEKSTSGASPSPQANAEPPNQPPSAYYHEFRTMFPATIGDPNLIGLLESHHITVEVSAPSRPWLLDALINWFPMLLLIGFFWWMATNAGRGCPASAVLSRGAIRAISRR